ncbi:MAG: SdpI family protein [Candidatus Eisenbacteria bacterium]
MKLSWKSEVTMWVLLAGMFTLAAITWRWAPARIPVHWNMNMQVDRYGGRFEGLLGIPLVAFGLYLLLLLLPRIDPGRANYAGFRGAFTTLRIVLVAFMAAIYGIIHLWLRGNEVNMGTVVPLLLGALFIVTGNLLGKLRPNWFVGIRTPWTLSSKDSWVRTHRAGGWVFIVAGLAFMAAGVLHAPWALWTASTLLMGGVVCVVVYSYFVWRADADKVPPADTSPA